MSKKHSVSGNMTNKEGVGWGVAVRLFSEGRNNKILERSGGG